MKKLLMPALALILSSTAAKAQSLYQAVYEKARSISTPSSAETEEAKANRFKIDALEYLSRQSAIQGRSGDSYFLDSQAVNLTSFIDDYLTNLQTAAKVSPAKRQEMMKCYVNAANTSPLFPADTLSAPPASRDELLPFSLNTDWEKAYDKATSVARLVLKKK